MIGCRLVTVDKSANLRTLTAMPAVQSAEWGVCRGTPARNSGAVGNQRTVNNLGAKAEMAAVFLKLFANDTRLLVLARLMRGREMSVNDLAQSVGLNQSALSQHLARLRLGGLVETRQKAQTVYYRLSKDARGRVLLPVLMKLFNF